MTARVALVLANGHGVPSHPGRCRMTARVTLIDADRHGVEAAAAGAA